MNEDKLKEECGVFGIFMNKNTNAHTMTYYGLYALQHRGEESSGIAITNGSNIELCKSMGLVCNLMQVERFKALKGKAAIGHVRYSTTGDNNIINAQPFLIKTSLGDIALAHNGNIINANELRERFGEKLNLQSGSDSEIILKLIGFQIEKGNSIEQGLIKTLKIIKGAYAITLLTKDKLIGVRDPLGIRPLCIGKLDDGYTISSESSSINALNGELIEDIAPGQIVTIDISGLKKFNFSKGKKSSLCAFEYIYFSREDSIIDHISVYKSRFLFGKELFKENPIKGDVVIGVPDSGIPAAMGYAEEGSIPYSIGLIKSKYVGRTFIEPCKELRKEKIWIKLSPIIENIRGKRVVVVDDSMVRGTTAKIIVKMLKDSGAREVHFRIASTMVIHPCILGIDIKSNKELISFHKGKSGIEEVVGADSIEFLSLEGFHKVLGRDKNFCFGCFNGEYPIRK
ncbi:amidophosphoribosyltransferase [uncultured Clostridium sp.]|uniref:amidophosphoribosyltransferase n=1 Tax=uncultured Clostridium sp. TaxID=59620 RepID=UPI0028EDFCF7|nr:amidophosphoribosyltransferase [uncultured Clostridium sp.]